MIAPLFPQRLKLSCFFARSLFAHDDDVTAVQFLPDTHLFFSCGKDGLIKQWDADKFLLIQVLKVGCFSGLSNLPNFLLTMVLEEPLFKKLHQISQILTSNCQTDVG